MIVFEENRILDFLKYGKYLDVNNTFNKSLGEYQNELCKRILIPNRDYIHLESCNDIQYKHKYYP